MKTKNTKTSFPANKDVYCPYSSCTFYPSVLLFKGRCYNSAWPYIPRYVLIKDISKQARTIPFVVCAYLKNQIYCYGGNQTPIINVLIDPELYTLNLSKTQLLDQLDWEPVKVKNDFVPEKGSKHNLQYSPKELSFYSKVAGMKFALITLQLMIQSYTMLQKTFGSLFQTIHSSQTQTLRKIFK